MSSLKTEYLENLTFTAEQISTLRSLGNIPPYLILIVRGFMSIGRLFYIYAQKTCVGSR